MKLPALNRRQVLRGIVAGTAYQVGLPILGAMLNSAGTAFADGSSMPRRFGTFFWGGGVHHATWLPKQTGASWDVPSGLAGIATPALKPYVTIVTGYNHKNVSPGHVPHRGIALSSSHDANLTLPMLGQLHPEPSVDDIISRGIGGKWAGISISCARRYQGNSSWVKGGTPRVFDKTPAELYKRLFSASASGMPQPADDSEKRFRALALNAIKEDAKQLTAKLGSVDKQRMEQHLDGISDLERELNSTMPPGMCSAANPGAVGYGDGTAKEMKADKTKIMSGLLAAGLACDAIRSFCFEFSGTQSAAIYWELGITRDHHDCTHGDHESVRRITAFIMEQFGVLADTLRRTPDGVGNLLEHTLILATSEHASAAGHNCENHPYLFVGQGGNIKPGIHYRNPNAPNRNEAPNVLLTAVRAMGVELPALGQESTGRRTTNHVADLMH